MSAQDVTSEVIDQLRESGADEHTTFFLGAGASTTSGLPSWDELVIRLLLTSGAVKTREAAELLLSRQDPTMVVEAARAGHGAAWPRKLRNALYENVASTDFSPLHRAVVSHVMSGPTADTTVVTLNFDTLLEEALEQETDNEVQTRSGPPDTPAGTYSVHHLHGVVSTGSVDGVVLTLTEFLDVISNDESWQLRLLRAALERGALIIAGTSYRDPDVRQWMHAALKSAPATHAAVVLLAREGIGVSRSDFSDLQTALVSQWQAVGIRPVLLHDYSDAAQVILELRHTSQPGYICPQDRARVILKAQAEAFHDQQPLLAQQLERDAEDLRDALDVDRLNVSLWIANGEGYLIRWAAQDRIYRDMQALRTVDAGYDSAWIAGKALGSDVLLIEDLPVPSIRHWRSVLALPLPIPHPTLPTMTAAVLTVALPDSADRYESSSYSWGPLLARIGDSWGEYLGNAAFGPDRSTLDEKGS